MSNRSERPRGVDAVISDIRDRIENARGYRERLIGELETLQPCIPALEAKLREKIRGVEVDLGWLQTQLQDFTDGEL